jgi:hypothetical protein
VLRLGDRLQEEVRDSSDGSAHRAPSTNNAT